MSTPRRDTLLLRRRLLHGGLHLLVGSPGLLGALQARGHIPVLPQHERAPEGERSALREPDLSVLLDGAHGIIERRHASPNSQVELGHHVCIF